MTAAETALATTELLQERISYLEESNLRYVAILEMLATSSDFQADIARAKNAAHIFKATVLQLKRLFPFREMGFMEVMPDGSFELTLSEPAKARTELQAEIDAKIMDGTFAWALNRNQAVMAPASGGKTALFHVIATRTDVRGIFVGLLPESSSSLDAPSLNALSIILYTCAYALESTTLHEMLRDHSLHLEERVQQRTQEVEAARQMAEAANVAKSEFLATMSHELRTPLNAIIGFTDVVVSGSYGPLQEIQTEFLGYVLQSSRHLLSLINDILDLSKIEAERMELELREVEVRTLSAGSLLMVRERAQAHNIRLIENVTPDVPDLIHADERKLKQMIFNLLANAVKFTPDGGSITLTISRAAEEGWLSVTVSDTGIGLRPEDVERIFNPFEQADGSATRKYEGTGLGLSLTRKLVELHGGKIWAESAGQDKGSTFNILLPAMPVCRLGETAAGDGKNPSSAAAGC